MKPKQRKKKQIKRSVKILARLQKSCDIEQFIALCNVNLNSVEYALSAAANPKSISVKQQPRPIVKGFSMGNPQNISHLFKGQFGFLFIVKISGTRT